MRFRVVDARLGKKKNPQSLASLYDSSVTKALRWQSSARAVAPAAMMTGISKADDYGVFRKVRANGAGSPAQEYAARQFLFLRQS
jgi:hypothetical protein